MFVWTVSIENIPPGLDPIQGRGSLKEAPLRVSVVCPGERRETLLTKFIFQCLVLPRFLN